MSAVRPILRTVAEAATQYVGNGWALVPIAAGTKGPSGAGWNRRESAITTADAARGMRASVGLAHAYSGTCALDIDDLEGSIEWCKQRGLDITAFLRDPLRVGINSGNPNHAKLLFRVAAPVRSIKVSVGKQTLFEFRCATADGRTVQDVLPPSVHPETGQPYSWDVDDLVGDWRTPPALPAALLEVWLNGAPRSASPSADPLDDFRQTTGLTVAQTEALLARVDPTGYDDWLRVGMGLHHEYGDEGLELWDTWSSGASNYVGREDLENRWAGFGAGGGPPITLRYLIKLAKAAGADVRAIASTAKPTPRFQFYTASEFVSRPAPTWIVKGVIPRAGLGMIFGESGSGKSFLALDLVAHQVTGRPWRGRKVAQGNVAYICAEGAGGFRNRAAALMQANWDLDGLRILDRPPNFLDESHAAPLAEAIGQGVQSVYVDTLAQVTAGGNENSGEDMGLALAFARRLHDLTGATIILVHHAGKDASKGARGWSGIRAACDFEIEVSRAGDYRAAKLTKQKDATDGGSFPFRLVPVTVGVDEDGEALTSCLVAEAAPATSTPKPKGTNRVRAVAALGDWCSQYPERRDISRADLDELLEGGGLDRKRRPEALAYMTTVGILTAHVGGFDVDRDRL